jgi:hypothetical protein
MTRELTKTGRTYLPFAILLAGKTENHSQKTGFSYSISGHSPLLPKLALALTVF